MPRPASVWWEGNSISISGKKVDFDIWTAFVRDKLAALEHHVEEFLLLGFFTLQDLENLFHISSILPTDSLGEGILFDANNKTFDNPQSTRFIAKVIESGALGRVVVGPQGQKLDFFKDKCLKYITDHHRAMMEIQPLLHILPGLPGRMTEESLYSPINTNEGPANVIPKSDCGTGAFSSRYHKGLNNTLKYKHILRLIPYRLFAVLYALVRVVRPLELLLEYEYIVSYERQQATADAYKGSIYASLGKAWTPLQMSENLARFIEEGTEFPMGTRMYRHFSIAVQRQKMNYGRFGQSEDQKALAAAADAMAVHSPEVADKVYARLQGVVGSAKEEALFVQVSKDYHAIYGIPTSKDDTIAIGLPQKPSSSVQIAQPGPIIKSVERRHRGKEKITESGVDAKKVNVVDVEGLKAVVGLRRSTREQKPKVEIDIPDLGNGDSDDDNDSDDDGSGDDFKA